MFIWISKTNEILLIFTWISAVLGHGFVGAKVNCFPSSHVDACQNTWLTTTPQYTGSMHCAMQCWKIMYVISPSDFRDMHTSMHTLHTYRHTCIHSSIHDRSTYIHKIPRHAYIHPYTTHIHTHRHTFITHFAFTCTVLCLSRSCASSNAQNWILEQKCA